MRLLVQRTDTNQKQLGTDLKMLRETRFFSERAQIKITIFIYGNKVAIISLNKKQPTGVLIEDADIRDTLAVFFEAVWKASSV